MTSEPEDPQENFNRWKRAVRLPASFPRLTEISDEELDRDGKFYIGLAHEDKHKEVLSAGTDSPCRSLGQSWPWMYDTLPLHLQ